MNVTVSIEGRTHQYYFLGGLNFFKGRFPSVSNTDVCDHATKRRYRRQLATPVRRQSRFRKSAQDDKWSFCLTVGTLCPTNQERP
jgi:hypothetical protein